MGRTWLAYELHLSSFAPFDLGLSRIDVFVDGSDQPVASYRDAELAGMRLDPGGKARASGALPAGGFEVIFVWLELGPDARPRTLRNLVVVKAGGE